MGFSNMIKDPLTLLNPGLRSELSPTSLWGEPRGIADVGGGGIGGSERFEGGEDVVENYFEMALGDGKLGGL